MGNNFWTMCATLYCDGGRLTIDERDRCETRNSVSEAITVRPSLVMLPLLTIKANQSLLFFLILQLISFVSTDAVIMTMSTIKPAAGRIIRIAEPAWRAAVSQHTDAIYSLLQPGLTPDQDPLNSGKKRHGNPSIWTALNPRHPVFNFLIEYYGLKGVKGPKRLARWSPPPALILGDSDSIETFDQLQCKTNEITTASFTDNDFSEFIRRGGILLEGANEDDMGTTLHLRGAIPNVDGMMYAPSSFIDTSPDPSKAANPFHWYRSVMQQTLTRRTRLALPWPPRMGHALLATPRRPTTLPTVPTRPSPPRLPGHHQRRSRTPRRPLHPR